MGTFEIIITILSSSVVTAIASKLFDTFIDDLQTKADYNREYHKKILDKQFEVYEKVEEFLNLFSTAVTDYKDNRFFYAIFGDENPLQSKYIELLNYFTKSNIWITEKLRDSLIAINRFMLENGVNFTKVEDGKKYYEQIGKLRDNALLVWKKDLVSLDNFNIFKNQVIKTDQELVCIKPIN